ncbi:MAG: RNA methyltransferase [Bacteriovoracaceae bacterium]|nr:RNA methyltransferase [Bacteriovoracaceae bacterium]
MINLYVGLVHHPIQNKNGEKVTTSVTNLDIHDISRSCRTFGAKRHFLVTPLKAQHELVGRILGHWETDKGSLYNPDRSDALSVAHVVDSIEDAVKTVETEEGVKPLVVITGANFEEFDGEVTDLKEKLSVDNVPCLLLFGTGWGLHAEVTEGADYKLAPLKGSASDGYNHLSVRSAVAIYLDRLMGRLL